MPLESPAGPLTTLEELVSSARRHVKTLERHFTLPVLLVVAPSEDWAIDVTQAREKVNTQNVSVRMFPTLVFTLPSLKGECRFGRAPDNAIILPFAAMSKHHGVIRESGGQWTIADIGSKNGTFCDGQRLQADVPVALRDGASIRFGDVTAKFWLPKSFCVDLERRITA